MVESVIEIDKPKYIIKKDLYRYYGTMKLPWIKRLIHPFEIKYLICFRKANYFKNFPILGLYYKHKLIRLTNKTQIQIPVGTKIGAGLYIGHLGSIIINPKAILGKNINLSPGVTIGKTNRGTRKGTPTLGNNIWIGTNSVIVGNIIIGDNVLIAPNSYVNFDVPNNSVVIGNPGIIHQNLNATLHYVNNTID